MPTYVLSQTWNRGGVWENQFSETYTYNAAGKLLTRLIENWWQGAWVNGGRWTYTYSGNNLTNELTEDGDSGGWIKAFQAIYTYNSEGTVSQTIYQEWK